MGRTDKLKEWMEKDTGKGIIRPIIADYDLKQTVELKKQINRHLSKIYVVCVVLCMLFVIAALVYQTVSIVLDNAGVIELAKNDTSVLAILILGLLFMVFYLGYSWSYSIITGQCNKRIEELAGVSNGTQEKE